MSLFSNLINKFLGSNQVNNNNISFKYGQHNVSIETGTVARQASGAVIVNMDDTVVLATVVGVPSQEPRDFFPLTVNYQERTYAAGKIPGGYFKREGRPSETETLISRLIDRPLRPLFPKGFSSEVQIVLTVLSLNPEITPDIPAMIAASAAVMVSGLPFNGPMAAARVGFVNGEYVLNPSNTELKVSDLELVVAGSSNAVLMVESEAKELTEQQMLGAVMYGHQQMQVVIKALNDLKAAVNPQPWEWQAPLANSILLQKIEELVAENIKQSYQLADKQERQNALKALREKLIENLTNEAAASHDENAIKETLSALEKKIVRERIFSGQSRIDGRDTKTVRPITIQPKFLPRTHGSVLFTRGETQAITVATLGTEKDAQIVDSIVGETKQRFMLHYNFPAYCVGEVGFMASPKRREIGHGALAKRALTAVIPDEKSFPYVIRIVSEITESNGSSSMATVCAGSLALMDAGVPIKKPVAGIAMGLVKEGDKHVILTDILGDEDHLGDMDFKVAGTDAGITALQMDIKIEGITETIMSEALDQAKQGRLHILNEMTKALSEPRSEMSSYAPRIINFKINPDKIRDVIGKGGVTIRAITEETGAEISIADDGVITLSSVSQESSDNARKRIDELTADVEVGEIYEKGKVVKIMEFGAFVNLLPGKAGFLHISHISGERIENIHDVLQEGQEVKVKVVEIDRQGRVRLGMKDI